MLHQRNISVVKAVWLTYYNCDKEGYILLIPGPSICSEGCKWLTYYNYDKEGYILLIPGPSISRAPIYYGGPERPSIFAIFQSYIL